MSVAAGAFGIPIRGQEAPILLPPYVTDVDGNGFIDSADDELVSTALHARRGFDLAPAAGFDYRADVLGRAAVDPLVVDSVRHSVRRYAETAEPTPGRPVTVAWHYGWYNEPERNFVQTVRFKTGNYVSFDPETETTFNELKNEFGVTVDALSWIPERSNQNNNTNYHKGYLRASNADTRHACLLYESTLALDVRGGRIDFRGARVAERFDEDFREMASFLARVRDDSPARVFTLQGRPVVFIFGTHIWGRLPFDETDERALEKTVGQALDAFAGVYGERPFLVGEEMQLTPERRLSDDRRMRGTLFDAIFIYHHAANIKRGRERLRMSPAYVRNQIEILRNTYGDAAPLRNRFTGGRLLVIPNLAPGFAKQGHPTLLIDRAGYADFMKLVKRVHMEEYVLRHWAGELGQAALPAPVYVVGSWNEEFEGHCLFPYDFNLSVSADDAEQHGFDIAMALKEVFGWNHYASRAIAAAGTAAPPAP